MQILGCDKQDINLTEYENTVSPINIYLLIY